MRRTWYPLNTSRMWNKPFAFNGNNGLVKLGASPTFSSVWRHVIRSCVFDCNGYNLSLDGRRARSSPRREDRFIVTPMKKRTTHLILVVEVENVSSIVLRCPHRRNHRDPFRYHLVLSIGQNDNLVEVSNATWPRFRSDRASSSPRNESFHHRIVWFLGCPDNGRDRQRPVYIDCPTSPERKKRAVYWGRELNVTLAISILLMDQVTRGRGCPSTLAMNLAFSPSSTYKSSSGMMNSGAFGSFSCTFSSKPVMLAVYLRWATDAFVLCFEQNTRRSYRHSSSNICNFETPSIPSGNWLL